MDVVTPIPSPTWTPGIIVEASTPTVIGAATATLTATPDGTVYPTSTAVPAPAPVVVAETPVVCGTLTDPCHTVIDLPVLHEDFGGGVIGLFILAGLVMPFLSNAVRIGFVVVIVGSCILAVLTAQLGYLFAPPLALICWTPLSTFLRLLGADRD